MSKCEARVFTLSKNKQGTFALTAVHFLSPRNRQHTQTKSNARARAATRPVFVAENIERFPALDKQNHRLNDLPGPAGRPPALARARRRDL